MSKQRLFYTIAASVSIVNLRENFGGAHLHFSSAYILKQLKQLFFSPRNYAAFLNRRAVARRKGKLFQTSCFPSLEDVVMNYTDAPGECENRRIAVAVSLDGKVEIV